MRLYLRGVIILGGGVGGGWGTDRDWAGVGFGPLLGHYRQICLKTNPLQTENLNHSLNHAMFNVKM